MNNAAKCSLRKEIERFRESQLNVYRAQPGRLQRDASSAKEAVRDHVGRWPYELVQNAEDAEASKVVVRFTGEAIYFADSGTGLPPGAVESLSGTHFSEKPVGSIGRKGLGFKAVYCVSANPAVFSSAEGLHFEREAAIRWMKQNDLSTSHVPYHWLPFWLSRSKEEKRDAALLALSDLRTVIRLPIPDGEQVSSAWKLLNAFGAETLLTFRHIRRLEVRSELGGYDIELVPGADKGVVHIEDSRTASATVWRTAQRQLSTPAHLLEDFEEGPDRDRVKNIEVRVGAPTDERGHIVPLKQRPCLYVYYPTEELSPLRLLLHGDFLIKSDRTAIVALPETPFNRWVARELASLLLEFVAVCYTLDDPAANLRVLLAPSAMPSRETGTLLWTYISEAAKAELLLPDTNGILRLRPPEALRLDLKEGHETARKVLQPFPATKALVHPSIDEDDEASKVLASLGVRALGASDIIECIRQRAGEQHASEAWVWSCWEWLAEWVGDDQERIEFARTLPVIPDDEGLISGAKAEGLFVTWLENDAELVFPDWLPLRFIAAWFRDRLLATDQEAVRTLATSLHIQKPTPDIALKALASAAKAYWDYREGDPVRFLQVLIETKWFETEDAPDALAFCPVPARPGNAGETWAPAQDAYFGEKWGEKRLAALFEGNNDVFWALPLRKLAPKKTARSLYEWLGVRSCPSVVTEHGAAEQREERRRVLGKLPYHTVVGEIPTPSRLEHIEIASLPAERVPILISILAANWEMYYEHDAHEFIAYHYRTWRYRSVSCLWWEGVMTRLTPPLKGYRRDAVPLQNCWLGTAKLGRLTPLLPCVDLSTLSKPETAVAEKWLREVVKLREQPEQLLDNEVVEILTSRIPALVPGSLCSDTRKRDNVSRWYNAILDALHGREIKVPDLSECPLLCRKGGRWAYIADEDVWLNDDNDAATAFEGEIWTISLKSTLHSIAEETLHVRRLSANKDVEFHWEPLVSGDKRLDSIQRLERLLDEVKPFLFAWVSHSRPAQDEGALKESLRRFRVKLVQDLKASIRLDGIEHARDVPRSYAFTDNTLILDVLHASESSLAKGLAAALNRVDDADFYDVLLRCPDEYARKFKLIQDRNLPETEVERYLNEWNGNEQDIEDLAGLAEDTLGSADHDTRPPRVEPPGLDDELGHETPRDREDRPTRREDMRKHKLRLKNPASAPLTEVAHADEGGGVGGGGSGGADGRADLTAEERARVEVASRAFVCAELQRQEYEVEEMSQLNPGFDIRATKAGAPMLLVEVKGHAGRSTLVDLTIREYEEYAKQLTSNNARWELWNIENLSADCDGNVLFSRHSQIPVDAVVGFRGLRINLRCCPFKGEHH